jgi:hypothetical protein
MWIAANFTSPSIPVPVPPFLSPGGSSSTSPSSSSAAQTPPPGAPPSPSRPVELYPPSNFHQISITETIPPTNSSLDLLVKAATLNMTEQKSHAPVEDFPALQSSSSSTPSPLITSASHLTSNSSSNAASSASQSDDGRESSGPAGKSRKALGSDEELFVPAFFSSCPIS